MATKIQIKTFGIQPQVTEKHLDALRQEVRKRVNIEPMFTSLSSKNIEQLFNVYDELAFGGGLRKEINRRGIPLKFQTSAKGKRFVGLFVWKGRRIPTGDLVYSLFAFRFPPQQYTQAFTKGEKTVRTAGLDAHDRLEALMFTFEHELIHMAQQLFGYSFPEAQKYVLQGKGGKIVYDGHGYLFQCMLYQYFQHRDTRSSLALGEAAEHATPSKIRPGSRVKVLNVMTRWGRQDMTGTVKRVHLKTARVALDNGMELNAPFGLIRLL